MLQKIRDNTQGPIAKIFVGFIIAVFALFGIDAIVGNFLTSSTELTVNGEEINSYDIETATQKKAQEFYSNLGEDADFTDIDESLFRASAVNELIQRELLRQSAENSGMVVSSASIDRRIVQTPDFQLDGVFNAERAQLLLQSMGFTPNSYRATLASETLLNQILAAYSASGFATSYDVQQLAGLVHQKRTFRFIGLGLDLGSADVDVSAEEIQQYYDENRESFMRPEEVKISYLLLDKQAMFDEVDIAEDAVRTAYDTEVANYLAQTERRAAHILFEAQDEESFVAAQAKATDIKARINAGEDFAALANEFSDDTGSAEDGGDVGYTTGDSFVPEFDSALQSLQVGEVSEPVRTEFGYHLIKLLEENATEIEPFESRKVAIERDLKSKQVDALFLERSEELGNLSFESLDLDEPASIMGLTKVDSDWFSRSGGIGITSMAGVISASFSPEVLEEGLNSELISLDSNRSVVIHSTDHRAADYRPLEEVEGEISVQLQFEQAKEHARMIGETIVSNLESGEDVSSLLEAQGVSWTQMDDVKRSEQRLNPDILNKIFALARPADGEVLISGFTVPTGEYVVVELQSVSNGTEADMEATESSNMANFLSQQWGASDFAAFMTNLQATAEIKGSDTLVNLDEEF